MSSIVRRKIFFWTLVVTFFIITPTIIAYSFGYRYSSERGIFIYSGSISIKPSPTKVSISIDDKPTSKRRLNYLNSSYHIDSLRPGTYKVSVDAPGHASWSKEVSVHSGISTEFWNILLPKNDPEIQTYTTPNIVRFFPAPKNYFYTYYSQIGNVFSVYTLSTDKDESFHVYSSSRYTFTDEPYKNIEWSPRSNKLIIPLSIKEKNTTKIEKIALQDPLPKKTHVIVDIESMEIFYLHDLYEQETVDSISSVRWSPIEEDVIYFLADNDLMKMDLLEPEIAQIVKSEVLAYDFSEDLLITAHMLTGIIFSQDIDAQDTTKQITTTSIENVDQCDQSCRLIAYDEKRIALIHKNGNLYLHNEGEEDTYPMKLIQNNVESIQFSDDGKKLLYWTNHELFAQFLRKWESQPYRSENENQHIARFFNPLSQVQWSKEYEHVIFFLDGKIQIIELDRRDKNNIQTLHTLQSGNTAVFGDFRESKLYFTDKNEGECCASLYSFEFPEKNGILGL